MSCQSASRTRERWASGALLDAPMRIVRVGVASLLVIGLGFSAVGTAMAEVVPVDPGRKVSAGKAISGTGQNLPTIDAQATWNIGPGPGSLVDAYYSSGAIVRDQREVSAAARVWTKKWVRETCNGAKKAQVRACKVAAVFDIDDTLLSSYPTLSSNNPAFTFSQEAFDNAATQCTATVIAPVKNLYLALQRMGMKMVLLTGRGESLRAATENCLRQAGITGWDVLIMRQPGSSDSAATYKFQARTAMEKSGLRIGPSVGDQISDMSLGALEHGFLIPNPMYLIP